MLTIVDKITFQLPKQCNYLDEPQNIHWSPAKILYFSYWWLLSRGSAIGSPYPQNHSMYMQKMQYFV